MISKNELEEVLELLSESNEEAENMSCEYNKSKYHLKEVDSEGWSDEGKYSLNYIIYALMKDNQDTDIRIGQGVSKYGSYYTDYEWDYEPIEQVEEVEVTVKKWVTVN